MSKSFIPLRFGAAVVESHSGDLIAEKNKPLSGEQLTKLCDVITNNSHFVHAWAAVWVEALNVTGCRPHEVLNMNLWQITQENDVILQPGKGNTARNFVIGALPKEFIARIEASQAIDYVSELRTLSRVINRSIEGAQIKIGGEFAAGYIFRHAFVRLNSTNFTTPEQFMSLMGWVNPNTYLSYIAKPITLSW